MCVVSEHEHDLMGSKKSCKFNTQISFFFGDIKLMSFQRNYRLITYEECYDRLIGLARDYLTPKFIFLTTKPACRSLNRVQRERDGERESWAAVNVDMKSLFYMQRLVMTSKMHHTFAHANAKKYVVVILLDWIQFNFNAIRWSHF